MQAERGIVSVDVHLRPTVPRMDRRRPGRPGISDEQADHVRALLRRVVVDRHGGNASALSRALGLSSSAISQMLSGKNRPSYDTVLLLSRHLGGPSPEEILEGRVRAAPVAEDPYPARAAALRRIADLLPPEVEARVRAVVLDEAGPQWDEARWLRLALRWREEQVEDDSLRTHAAART